MGDVCILVRKAGLEPARQKASGPKPGASTNFATPAREEGNSSGFGAAAFPPVGCEANHS